MKKTLPILFFSVFFLFFAFLLPKTNPVLATTTTLTPSADAMILSNNGNGNYGGNTLIDTSLLATGKSRMLVKFNVGSVPANATINSATFSIKFYGCGILSEAINDLNITRIKSSWTEYGVTWNTHKNAFDFDNELNFAAPCSASGSYLNYNVKTLVNNWRNGEYQNYGFGLFGNEGAVEEWIKIFYSKENPSNKPPKLTINYTVPGQPSSGDESTSSDTSDQTASDTASDKDTAKLGSDKKTATNSATTSAQQSTPAANIKSESPWIRIALFVFLLLLLASFIGGYIIYRRRRGKPAKKEASGEKAKEPPGNKDQENKTEEKE